MNNNKTNILSPEACATKMLELSGLKFVPNVAAELWPKILQHIGFNHSNFFRDYQATSANLINRSSLKRRLKRVVPTKQCRFGNTSVVAQ